MLDDEWYPCPCCDGNGGSYLGPFSNHSQQEDLIRALDAIIMAEGVPITIEHPEDHDFPMP